MKYTPVPNDQYTDKMAKRDARVIKKAMKEAMSNSTNYWEKIPSEKRIHILPVNDQHEHNDRGYRCLCNPKLRIENKHLIIIHNSWDGRELKEQNAPVN